MQAVHGVKWTGVSTIITTALLYIRLAVLAHLLSPRDFGLMGMVLMIIGFGQAFADMGISNAIIWKQDVTSEQLSTLYWLNILASIAVFGIVIAISPFVSAFFHQPRLTNLVYWVAFIFPITAVGQQFQMLLQKELRFKSLAKVEVASTALGTAVAITAAFMHQGVYALVWGQLTASVSMALLYAVTGWRKWHPRLIFKPKKLQGMISFGLYQMGERTMNFFAFNVDYIMVGRFLGPKPLGVYMLAWQLMVQPAAKFNPILTRVAFPVFSRRQSDDGALRRGYVELSKMVAVLTFPIMVLAAVTAPVLVPAIFGPQWTAAVPIVQIFLLLGLLRSLTNPVSSLLLAKGRADIGFELSIGVAVVSAVVFWFAAQAGLIVMAWAEVAVFALIFIVVMLILNRLIGLKFSHYFKDIGKPTLLAAVAGGATYGFYQALKGVIHSNLYLLIILVVLGVLAYGLLVALFEREYFLTYFWLFLGKKRQKVPAPDRDVDQSDLD